MSGFLPIMRMNLAPMVAILFLMLGNGFFVSFISLRLDTDGFASWIVGAVQSAYYLGMLFGAMRAEAVINKVGHIRAYAAYAAIGTVSLMLQGLFAHPLLWVASRTIMGFSIAVYYVVVESWFLSNATLKTRGVILSTYMISMYFSQAASQFILNFINLNDASPFFIAGILNTLSALPLTLTRTPLVLPHEASGHSLRSLFHTSPFGFCGCLIAGVILSSIYSFAPLFATMNELSVSMTMSICIFGGVLLQWPVGKLSDLLDRRRVLFGVATAAASQSLLIAAFDLHGLWVYSLLFVFGGLSFVLYPLSITEVCDRLQPEDITKATGMLLLAYGIGAVLGPLIAPSYIDAFPNSGLFLFTACSAFLLVLVGLRSFWRLERVPDELQAEFVPLPRVTPVAYELDPRFEQATHEEEHTKEREH